MQDPSPHITESPVSLGRRAACPLAHARRELRRVRLRATRQRVMLGWLLFGKGDRHLTAEMLYAEATQAGLRVSLTTVYNTLHQFAAAGLVRETLVPGQTTYFDTNLAHHHHFLVDGEHLIDAPSEWIEEPTVLGVPSGHEIERVEVVVQLRSRLSGVSAGEVESPSALISLPRGGFSKPEP